MSKVYLVGAGPGDPGLITVKGRDALSRADCVLYDHLACSALLDLAPPAAERVYVGKKRSVHACPQEEICAMLVERARAGKTVVRLKGGDPFVFGRGGEEVEALAAAGVGFEVVPGVTSPLGAAAYCGVPLTHRDYASVVSFVTGHQAESIDWSKVGQSGTLVVFMGLTAIEEIARRLIAHGRDPQTPSLAVRWATRPEQQTVVAPLVDLPARTAAAGMKPPATVIIGEVVSLRGTLAWYERLPLFGRRVVVTRAQAQAGTLAAKLSSLGAAVTEFPTIAIRPAAGSAPLERAVASLDTYDWLIFTSVNGVRYFLEALDRSSADLRKLKARLCAIGPATRHAIEALHLKVDLCPQQYVAESLLEAFSGHELAGRRILLPRAAVARDLIPAELERRGAVMDVVEAYRTVLPEDAAARAAGIFADPPDWITFTSSSTVTNFLAAAGEERLRGVRIASIGPVTSRTAHDNGLVVDVEARRYTIDGLVEAILEASR